MYRKILFCTDLYPNCDYAFASALDMAEQSGAELIVLHVLESRHRYSGQLITDDGEVWGSAEVFDKLKDKLQEYYLMRVEEEKHNRLRFKVRGGSPWLEILRVAWQEKADLIVMGPYTVRGSVLKFISHEPQLGRTAQAVSLRARCPVSIFTSPKQRQVLEAIEP
ncbi:MAG: universal stress protein [Desulfobacterales bacterium]|nr:MAG: universal stress protein [Desulfobacterales bacterium]